MPNVEKWRDRGPAVGSTARATRDIAGRTASAPQLSALLLAATFAAAVAACRTNFSACGGRIGCECVTQGDCLGDLDCQSSVCLPASGDESSEGGSSEEESFESGVEAETSPGDGDGDVDDCGFFEGWEESATPNTLGWTSGGIGAWGVSPWEGGVYAGTYGARSEELNADDASWLRRTVSIPDGGATLQFWFWASVGTGDGLEVRVDGSVERLLGPTAEFAADSLALPEGTYELEFRAFRDSSGAAGIYNRVWLDDIEVVCP